MKLKCLIVDDEPVARQIIGEYIEDITKLEVIGEADNAKEAIDILADQEIDLIFLDIEMPKVNGINFLKSLKNQPLIIITTAYPNFAIEGFDLGVVDYLLKPISIDRFLKAVNKAIEIAQLHKKKENRTEEYFYIKSNGVFEKIMFAQLFYVEAFSNYVALYTEKEKKVVYLTIKALKDQLPDSFVQVHKSFLVSTNKVVKIEADNLYLTNGKIIHISDNYRENIMTHIKKNLIKR